MVDGQYWVILLGSRRDVESHVLPITKLNEDVRIREMEMRIAAKHEHKGRFESFCFTGGHSESDRKLSPSSA